MVKERKIDKNRLDELCGAYLAVEELVGLGGTVIEREGDLHMVNSNHFYDLLHLLNEELKYALGRD